MNPSWTNVIVWAVVLIFAWHAHPILQLGVILISPILAVCLLVRILPFTTAGIVGFLFGLLSGGRR